MVRWAAQDSFAAGYLFEATQTFPSASRSRSRSTTWAFTSQDQWKLSPNFQFTAGVRVEHNSNAVCQTNCFGRFGDTYSNVTAGLDTPYNSVIVSGLRQAFNGLQGYTVDPRLGFTWSPKDHSNTVVRGGIGMFTDIFPATFADDLLTNPPLEPGVHGRQMGSQILPSPVAMPICFRHKSILHHRICRRGSYNSILAQPQLHLPSFSTPTRTSTTRHIKSTACKSSSRSADQQASRSDMWATMDITSP